MSKNRVSNLMKRRAQHQKGTPEYEVVDAQIQIGFLNAKLYNNPNSTEHYNSLIETQIERREQNRKIVADMNAQQNSIFFDIEA